MLKFAYWLRKMLTGHSRQRLYWRAQYKIDTVEDWFQNPDARQKKSVNL